VTYFVTKAEETRWNARAAEALHLGRL